MVRAKQSFRFELETERMGRQPRNAFDRIHGVAQKELRTHPLQRKLERRGELLIHPGEQAFPPLDQGDARSQGSEETGVLGSDDAASHHRQGGGDAVEIQDPIAVHDVGVLHADPPRRRGRRPGRDQEDVRRQTARYAPLRVEDGDGIRILEAGGSRHEGDPVARQVAFDLPRLAVGNVLEPADELPQALLPVQAQAHAVELAAPEPGQVESGLAEGL